MRSTGRIFLTKLDKSSLEDGKGKEFPMKAAIEKKRAEAAYGARAVYLRQTLLPWYQIKGAFPVDQMVHM